jgi:hypothetical protein
MIPLGVGGGGQQGPAPRVPGLLSNPLLSGSMAGPGMGQAQQPSLQQQMMMMNMMRGGQ